MDLVDTSTTGMISGKLPPLGSHWPLIDTAQTFGVCPGLDPFDIQPPEDPDDPFGLGLTEAPGAALNKDVEARDALKNLVEEYERVICRLVAEKEISNNRLDQMVKILNEKLRGEKLKSQNIQERIAKLQGQKRDSEATITHLTYMQKNLNDTQTQCEQILITEKKDYEDMKNKVEEAVIKHMETKKNITDERDRVIAKLTADIEFAEKEGIPELLKSIAQKKKETVKLGDRCSELLQIIKK